MKRPLAHTRALTPGLGRCHRGGGGGGGGAESSWASAEGESRPPAGTTGVSGCQGRVRGWRGVGGVLDSFIPPGGAGRSGTPGEMTRGRRPARLAVPVGSTKDPCALALAASSRTSGNPGDLREGRGGGGGGAGRPDRSESGSYSLLNFAVPEH